MIRCAVALCEIDSDSVLRVVGFAGCAVLSCPLLTLLTIALSGSNGQAGATPPHLLPKIDMSWDGDNMGANLVLTKPNGNRNPRAVLERDKWRLNTSL